MINLATTATSDASLPFNFPPAVIIPQWKREVQWGCGGVRTANPCRNMIRYVLIGLQE